MRKGAFAEGEFRCVGDPSLREEERSGRDDADCVCALVFLDLARGFSRNGAFTDSAEGELRCAGDPSLREEERSGRDDADCVGAFGFNEFARGFTYSGLRLFHGG